MERKKKGRLYSLGGNEPQRKNHRGRLDRLKTVGTFDLGTEMSVLSQVARNLNEQLISGELGILPIDANKTIFLTSPFHSSVHTSARNTPELRKRDIGRRTPIRSPLLQDGRCSTVEFRGQHSADDCIQSASPTHSSTSRKARSLSTSSYARDRYSTDSPETRFVESDKSLYAHQELEKDSKKIEEDVVSAEHTSKRDFSKDFSYRSRKSMLRKSKRIVLTDAEIFKEGIIDRNEYVLRNNCDIQIHANQESESETSEARDVFRMEKCRNSSVASSSFHSRKDSSEIDDICSPKDRQKSTDESSKNLSTDEMDAVFSDSNTDLEKLEKEYKELVKSNLQREYKSDGDTLDEIGKKRSEFGKWKNQSLEHEFEYSNQELMNIIGDYTLSTNSYCASTDTKDVSRICSPESCANGAYSDSGVKCLDEKFSTYAKMRSRVYSSSRLGETPTERERLYPIRNNGRGNFPIPMAGSGAAISVASDITNVDSSGISRTMPLIRPSNLEINVPPRPKASHENPIHSLFEKPFGKFKRVNKLLKCKRFSASTLYDKKKPQPPSEAKGSPKLVERVNSKESEKAGGLTETKSAINLSKLSLFSQKPGKPSTFWGRTSGMFSATSRSNNELFSKTGSKTKLSEISKSSTELNKFKASPLKTNKKKGSKFGKSGPSCLPATICHSPLSEEFYNKTGSVRLSAVELYEKFCSEDFSGLYKDETNRRLDMHEYRLEQKGLRVIGRYNKNARLLKQKSEPKFNLRGTPGGSCYYHEEDEYYYHNRPPDSYGYYNEQDEYYNEYDDEDVEDIERDYYEDDDEGDYYEDDVDGEDTEIAVEDSPRFIDKDDQSDLAFQYQVCGATCLELSRESAKKSLEVASTGTDSDVDEIYLMPAESKCMDEDEYGFENKQFSLEHSMLVRSNVRDRLVCLEDVELTKLSSEENTHKSTSSAIPNHTDEVLTIYRICSREEMMKISDNEADEFEKLESKKQRSTSLQTESLQKAVKEYIKYATSEMSIEPTIVKTDCTSIDRTDSLELLSNSSGTMRSRSTLTEYAFDTVRNMNLDSCSTSKLSLSLKSEVFDDFTITPDELKTIQNCEIEDFTLTPDGSMGDSATEVMNNAKTSIVESTKFDEVDKSCMMEEDCPSGVLIIVDKFLENERNNLHRQMSVDEPTVETKHRGELLETSFDEAFGRGDFETGSRVESQDDGKIETDSAKDEYMDVCRDDSKEESKASDSYHTPTTEQESTTSNDYTVIDLYDDNEESAISFFTSELTKKFDELFSQAEQFDFEQQEDDPEESGGDQSVPPPNEHELTVPCQSKIPSRYSMQRLEPYYIADPEDVELDPANGKTKISAPPLLNKIQPVEESHSNNKNNSSSKSKPKKGSSSSSRLKKTRSQSLGNLNKKTKCFPL